MMDICKLCHEPLLEEQTVTLGDKGCAGILKASEQRQSDVKTVAGDVVHTWVLLLIFRGEEV